MANLVYNTFFEHIQNANIDLDTDTIKIALLDTDYTPSAAHEFIDDVITGTEEITATGYTAGGATLANVTIASQKFDADNPTWTIVGTLTARYAVVYKDTGTPATSPVACLLDFGGNKSVTDGPFTVEFHANGIITYAQTA